MKKLLKIMSVAMLVTALMPVMVFADSDSSDSMEVEDFAGIKFAAGSSVTLSDTEAGDIFAVGEQTVIDDSAASGNIFAAGNQVELKDSYCTADVFAAGNRVLLDDFSAEGNAFLAGKDVEIKNAGANSYMIAASTVDFEGGANAADISAAEVEFNGIVTGDVSINATNVVIGENAVIMGSLEVYSENEPDISDGARIQEYVYTHADSEAENKQEEQVGIVAKTFKKLASRIYWIPAMLIFGLVLCLFFGKGLDEARDMVKSKTAAYVISGAVCWIAVPAAAFILAITIIGLPLAGIAGLAYVVLILAGLTFAGASLGRLVLPKLNPILSSLIGVAVLEFVRIIPLIGTLVAIAADMYLLGYVALKLYENMPKKMAAAPKVYAKAVESIEMKAEDKKESEGNADEGLEKPADK